MMDKDTVTGTTLGDNGVEYRYRIAGNFRGAIFS